MNRAPTRVQLMADDCARPTRDGYTLLGEPEVERRIDAQLGRITEALQERVGTELRALLLLGSYARGEGSVVERDGELGAYNDYDLMVVLGRGARTWRTPLSALGDEYGAEFGIDVDIYPIDEGLLSRVPRTLLWLDVALGAVRVLAGDPTVLAPLAALTARRVPMDEAGRLLANRATGLALSNFQSDYEQRRARHGHKLVLALGDALLLAADRYHGSLATRLKELERLMPAPGVGSELVAAYREAARFRVRPDAWTPPGGATLQDWFVKVRQRCCGWHLQFEAWRTGAPEQPAAYARYTGRLFPGLPDVRVGGGSLAAVRAAAAGVLPLLPYLGHPRERLARVSVALAYAPDESASRRAAAWALGLGPNAASTPELLIERLLALSARGG